MVFPWKASCQNSQNRKSGARGRRPCSPGRTAPSGCGAFPAECPRGTKQPRPRGAGRGSWWAADRNSLFFISADRFLEGLACRELGDFRRLDPDLGAGLRVPPHPGLPVADGECPEPRQRELASLLQGRRDGLREPVEGPFRLALRNPPFFRNERNQFRLRHRFPSCRFGVRFLIPGCKETGGSATVGKLISLKAEGVWGVKEFFAETVPRRAFVFGLSAIIGQ